MTRLLSMDRWPHGPMARFFSLLVLTAGLVLPSFAQEKEWQQIPKPPLPEFKPQQPVRVALPNGMVIFLQPDRELPLIDGFARIRGGARDEPAEKVGLVSLFGQAWRTGGTGKRTGDELDEFLEARAASVETGGSTEFTSISFSSLKEDFEDVFAVFLEVLRDPAFREDKLRLARTQLNTGIARRNDDIGQIAARESTKLGYGPQSPYARVPEYATVAAVTRDDLLEWHRRFVHPNNIIFGIAGDFDVKQMEARLRQAFSSWAKGPAAKPAPVQFPEPSPGVYFIQKDDVNQSAIRMVHLGLRRDHPDFYAVEVLNEAFGGGMSARLFRNLRSARGLAYSVGGGIGVAFDRPGLFRLSMGTRSNATAESIEALLDEVRALRSARPITATELRLAKDAILNSFVFNFDSKGKVLRERMVYEFYGYPADTLERYRAGIERVSLEDVNRAAARHVHPEKLAILVVGRAADFDRPLSAFGAVQNIDITIPPPGGPRPAPAAAGPAAAAQARALMLKVATHFGGADKLAQVKSARMKHQQAIATPQGEMLVSGQALMAFPDRTRVDLRLPMGAISMIVGPQGAFMLVGPAGAQPMPGSIRDDLLANLKREKLWVLQRLDDPRFIFDLAGTEKLGDVEAQIVDIDADGVSTRWFIEAATGRLLRAEYVSSGPAGPAPQTVIYSDWREVGGIRIPFRSEILRDGSPAGWTQIEELELNPQVDPAVFQPPPDDED
jgi:zinc protease